MFRIYLFFTLFLSIWVFSQEVSGTVTDDEGNALATTLVFNMNNEQRSYTNRNGEFSIAASANDELRFTRTGFKRSSKIVNVQDFNSTFKITIFRTSYEIDEVKINRQPTGNLEKDTKNYGDIKVVAKMKLEIAEYIRSESTPEVLAPKAGEFLQQAGSAGGTIDNKWDDVDFMEFLIKNIEQDFFTDDLHLKDSEIQSFIYYIFRNFPRKQILFRGICTPFDLSRFMKECYEKIEFYRKKIPNNPPKTRKRK